MLLSRPFPASLSWPWPLPALSAWAASWAMHAVALRLLDLSDVMAFLIATATGLALSLSTAGRWRQGIAATGFPLSMLALQGTHQLTPLAWLGALALLALAYPLRAWRDAPFFPTQWQALKGLDRLVKLAPGASVLDAGCGAGHGLAALARVWPRARLHGVEWSRPLAWWASRRMPQANILRGDMWAGSWSGHDLVYLFQRPETMPRAWDKACAEMRAGSHVVSLEFEVPGVLAVATLAHEGHRKAWVYRVVRANERAA